MRYNCAQIHQAFLVADHLLNGPVCPPEKVVRLLAPFFDCTEVTGAHGQMHEDIRSMIFALAGDAYRRAGNVTEAAVWYKRASAISPGGHAVIYAHMVCKHQLADYYSDAFMTIQEHRRRWMSQPALVRAWRRLVTWPAWLDKEGREIMCTESKDYQFLSMYAQPSRRE